MLFVHQLPSYPSKLRVTTWRRLQQLGAVALKQAVYVLPDTADAREDFEWLRLEVTDAGGDATVFAAAQLPDRSSAALIEEFRHARQTAYTELSRDIDALLTRAGNDRRPRGTRAPALRRLLDIYRERLVAIEKIDFFASAGRDGVLARLQQLEKRLNGNGGPRLMPGRSDAGAARAFTDCLWVTRPRPGVDRMASAWLIRRFIDQQARFAFAADSDTVPRGGVPFDMFGVEFTHRGDRCTFETLCEVFELRAPALGKIAAIVHDLDLKDGKFGAAECAVVGTMIEGLQLADDEDDALLAQGMTLFESLFRAFERSATAGGPRLTVRARKPPATARRAHRAKPR